MNSIARRVAPMGGIFRSEVSRFAASLGSLASFEVMLAWQYLHGRQERAMTGLREWSDGGPKITNLAAS
jgi:hypothetical protein